LGNIKPANLQSSFADFYDELLQRFSPEIIHDNARMRLISMFFQAERVLIIFIPNTFCPLFF
jgi:hypothetical protein